MYSLSAVHSYDLYHIYIMSIATKAVKVKDSITLDFNINTSIATTTAAAAATAGNIKIKT